MREVPMYREFTGLDIDPTGLSDETIILRFRRLLGTHQQVCPMLAAINEPLRSKGLMLRAGTVVDATLIAAPSSTNEWHSGTKAWEENDEALPSSPALS